MSEYKLKDGTVASDCPEGSIFILQKSYNNMGVYTGSKVVLKHDDGSRCPWFEEVGTGKALYIEWEDLIPESNPQKQLNYRVINPQKERPIDSDIVLERIGMDWDIYTFDVYFNDDYSDCVILRLELEGLFLENPVEYTMEELTEKLGHPFTIKED